jgi:anti-anti-sigma factor
MPIHEWSDAIIILELSNEPAFSEDMDSVMRRLEESAPRLPDVICNAQGVSYVNSSNIAQLLKLRKRLVDAGGRLRLCAMNDQVWSIMLATGLDQVFEFTDDVATSLASLLIAEGDERRG